MNKMNYTNKAVLKKYLGRKQLIPLSIKKGERFESKIFRKGLIEKSILYTILMCASLVLGKLLQTVFDFDVFYISWTLSVMICVYEISSVIENIVVINPNLAYLNAFKTFVKSIGKKQVESVTEKFSTIEADKKEEGNVPPEPENGSIS